MTDIKTGVKKRAAFAVAFFLLIPVVALAYSNIAIVRSEPLVAVDKAALNSFFEALYQLETGASGKPVRILHLGDSHTAADSFSGRMRELFQERFGNGGRGMLAPGKPWSYFRPRNVSVDQSKDWEVASSFSRNPEGIFGITGFRARGEKPEDEMTVRSADGTGFSRIGVEAATGPGRGSFSIIVDGKKIASVPTAAKSLSSRSVWFELEKPGMVMQVRPRGNGPVELLSWTVESGKPGVVYDSQGIVGATVDLIGKWEPATLEREVKERNPALVMIVFGTNEGFNDRLNLDLYGRNLAGYLAQFKKIVPQASQLVVGPPDGNRIPRWCLSPTDSRGRRLPKRKPDEFSCAPLTEQEIENYAEWFPRKGKPKQCKFHPPPQLYPLRDLQRKTATGAGAAFWDWSGIMGGPCGSHRWFSANTPFAAQDHIHFTRAGYSATAEKLFEQLMKLYEAYKAGRK